MKKLLERIFGHDCRRFEQISVMEPCVVTGYPYHVGDRCPVCNKIVHTSAWQWNEHNKKLTPEGYHWEADKEFNGWVLVKDELA